MHRRTDHALAAARPAPAAFTTRRHIDLARVTSASCRRAA
ncbi:MULTISPECIES: putative leader peptide [unclassified Streptomyces]|nr:putative leader peptide [Streptomyces sp. HmicA12]